MFDYLIIFRNADGRQAWLRGVVMARTEHEARDKAMDGKPSFVFANLISVEAMDARAHRCIPEWR